MYTLQIHVESTTPLDGMTPLGESFDRSANRTVQVTVPSNMPFGRFDPGKLFQLEGRTLVLVGFSATAPGQPFTGTNANVLERVTPAQGGTEGIQQIVDIATAQGMFFDSAEIFPFAHLLAVTTTVTGPTRLIFLFKELTDEDVVKLGLASKATGGGGGGGVVAHSATTGKGPDDHHPQLHTIGSHSDTAATGAQLNTLVLGGNADPLHTHVASDKIEDEFAPTNGQVTFILSQAPNDLPGLLMLINGLPQDRGVDFAVSGVTVTWFNTTHTIEATDKVVFTYR